MSDKSNGGPNVGLLLLIPAAAIVARAAMHHRQMMWAEVDGPGFGRPGPGGPGFGGPYGRHGHRHFAGPGFAPSARGDFRLPPRLESMLDAWHTRAHEAVDSATQSGAEPQDATA